MRIIDFKETKCMHCYKCVRYCDVKAIMIKNGKAEIMEDNCILCGHCLHVCPQSAKTMVSDLDTVKYYVRRGVRIAASLAPSYMGFFRGVSFGQLRAALRKLGFFEVRETAEGAAAVTEEYVRLLKEGKMENIITTCCPSVNDLIEIYYPQLTPYMAPVVSPMTAHGWMLKKEYGEEIKTVFIGPCIAKKKEALDARNAGSVDAVLNFNDIRRWLSEAGIDPKQCEPEEDADKQRKETKRKSGVNRLYPVTGGVICSVLAAEKETESYRKFHVHGTKNCMEVCESLLKGELTNSFIEMNMCKGGCINGSAPLIREVSRFCVKLDMEEQIERVPADEEAVKEWTEGLSLDKQYFDHSAKLPTPTDEQIRNILLKTGKFSQEDELNCGACGYPTCREKAIAVFQNKAELNMCIPFMYDKAESMSNLVMETSPNMVVMVDKEMKIQECSAICEHYFGKSRSEAVGMYLFEFLDPTDFEWVYQTHQSIRGKKVTYLEYDLTALLNIVYVEKKDLVLATIVDITEKERQEQEEYEKKLRTVELANEVIRRQMTVAQEIAGLLGETTAQTKITLMDLCDSLLGEGEENGGKR